jgi:hypothetical protein
MLHMPMEWMKENCVVTSANWHASWLVKITWHLCPHNSIPNNAFSFPPKKPEYIQVKFICICRICITWKYSIYNGSWNSFLREADSQTHLMFCTLHKMTIGKYQKQ